MKIIYSNAITKDVRKIKDQKLIDKIIVVVNTISDAKKLEDLKNLKKMKGHPSAYRIRIGDYRLGLYYEDNTVILARFVKRNDIYNLFP